MAGSQQAAIRWWQSLGLFLVLLTCYSYFPPRWADWNQNSRLDLVMALVDDHTLHIDKYVANTGDYAYHGGHYYSDKAPGLALLGVPVYAALRGLLPSELLLRVQALADGSESLKTTLRPDGAGLGYDRTLYFVALGVTTFVAVAIPSALLGVILLHVVMSFGSGAREALASTALYGLGTSAFPYANAFYGHQTSAFLLFAAFAVLLAVRRGRLTRSWLVLAGFLSGYAAITEYSTVLIGAILGVYALAALGRALGSLVRLALGAAPPLVLLVAYDLAAFGTPLPVGYAYSELWADLHHTGFLSLTYPRLEALWGITFGLDRGLFVLSPFLLFALPGYLVLWRDRSRRPELWVSLSAPLVFFLFNASSAMWQGGFAVGPRYLVPSLPFLMLAVAPGAAWAWRHLVLRPVLVVAGAWSLFAVWVETIAGQSFPDYTPNPLFDLSLPRLMAGDVARNVGMLLGLDGWTSLLPLLLALLCVVVAILSFPSGPVRPIGAPGRVGGRARWAS